MKKDFLFEIGTEEIPHDYLSKSHIQFEKIFIETLSSYNLNYAKIYTYSTPRRLAILITDLEEKQEDRKIIKKGPPKNIAYHENGEPTQALKGFLSTVSSFEGQIKILKEGEKEFVFFEGIQKGEYTEEILKREIPRIVKSIEFPKTMRWSNVDFRFVRPIRWIVCLFGDKILDIELATIKSSNISYGHRFIGENVEIKNPREYEELLENKGKVIPSPSKRKEVILKDVEKISKELNSVPVLSEKLLEEIVNLVEYPKTTIGTFDEKFLEIPNEILISEMVEHQKFIPLTRDSKLINKFIIVVNTQPNEKIVKGNQKVISARLNDGKFLYEEDTKKSIEFFIQKTKELIFFAGLGTIYDKMKRMEKLSQRIMEKLKIQDEKIKRASSICKFDLTTGVVYEFPELQGIMGYYYSLNFGEEVEVANYIKEHYKPISSDDELPSSLGAGIVSITDKLDNIFSLYSAGKKVSGSSDPYGLRRQLVGVSRIMINYNLDIDIVDIFTSSKEIYEAFFTKEYKEITEDLKQFVNARLKGLFKEMGFRTDEIEATIKATTNPYDAYLRVKTINNFRNKGEFANVGILFKRVRNILNEAKFTSPTPLNYDILTPEERELYNLILSKKDTVSNYLVTKNYEELLKTLLEFQKPIHNFFEKVFVMDKNTEIRQNRLSLLYQLYKMFEDFIDFNIMELA
ncbi:MAG: glycine--tRNA ligase subunit beta [Brevinematales bacterium]|nr:glycine--tRNA ligase subunit beta [Brevinematales bacterium]